MATKRKSESKMTPPVKKVSLDWQVENEPLTPKRRRTLTSILKKGEDSPIRSPANKSVTFPPPTNMRETLSCIGDTEDASIVLLGQLETLQGTSLVMWLGELQGHISLLDRKPGQGGTGVEMLVTELLKLKWADQVDEVSEAYTSFLVNLVSACPCYTRQTVKALFGLFKPAGDDDQRTKDSIIFGRAHSAIQSLLLVSPVGAREEVLSQMSGAFPYFKSPAYRQVCFVSALLEMTCYVLESRHIILSSIVEKLIKLDAHLSRDYVESSYKIENEENKSTGNMVNSLDLLLKLMFTYIKENTHSNGQFDEIKAQPIVDCLFQIYTSHLLPTYNIVHTQFLLFYVANLSAGLTQRFLSLTWRTFSSPNSPSILRQTAMSYMASFLSRSANLTTPQVLSQLAKLSAWAHSYVRNKEAQDSAMDFMYTDLSRHGPFYAACQAIFYTFAFRHQELTSSPRRMKIVQGLAWHSLVACGLNPLRVCLPGVVRNFSACARHYQLAYCQAVIERNNRINLPVVGSQSSNSSVSGKPHLLDCFFPFDPCLLQRCKEWVEPNYLQYHGLSGLPDEEEEDMSEDENGNDEEASGERTEGRKRLDSSRSSISSVGTRSRKDSVGCLTELLLQDISPMS